MYVSQVHIYTLNTTVNKFPHIIRWSIDCHLKSGEAYFDLCFGPPLILRYFQRKKEMRPSWKDVTQKMIKKTLKNHTSWNQRTETAGYTRTINNWRNWHTNLTVKSSSRGWGITGINYWGKSFFFKFIYVGDIKKKSSWYSFRYNATILQQSFIRYE